ncbi:MAG TPA: META domain-containing protein [Cyclobacteriaceae bacterium]|nr:META domain-containing protein [Cyclobacteriaceae bacterium]HRJ82266.1 META domain-containing protein [Cyclobacteriaceae bacterium]
MKPVSVAALIILFACQTQNISLFDTEWKLKTINGKDYATVNPPATLTFTQKESRLSGYTGCNRFFGGFELADDNLNVGQLGATKMFCENNMDLESNYLKALEQVKRYRIKGNSLQLLNGATVVLEFTN